MVVGTRQHEEKEAYRGGHVLGNKLFTGLLSGLFGRSFTDIFSGYRVFSRRFVKSFPVLSSGFEIETEMSVHALELRMPVGEIETAYAARPEGSAIQAFDLSRRLADPEDDRARSTGSSGRCCSTAAIGALLLLAAILLAVPLVLTYLDTGLVPRFPTAILVTGMVIIAVLCFFAGLILDTVTRGRREIRRLAYLSLARRPGGRSCRSNCITRHRIVSMP